MNTAIALLVGALVSTLGIGGAVLIVLASNPEKVQLWAAMLLRICRTVTKRAEYAYVATDVAAQVNSHLATDVVAELSGVTATRIAVRWDNSKGAVVREVAGTVIVRMRPHEDRVLNVLTAYLIAVPRLIAPAIRSQIENAQSRAIDLQLCRKLAESMSASAMVVYSISIRDPDCAEHPTLAPLLTRLHSVDTGGLFVPVLLQELIKLGSKYPADSLPNLSPEIEAFTGFLQAVAERSAGQDVPLTFLGRYLRVNLLLVARSEMRAQGTLPYRTRLSLELAKGCDTFYVLATRANIAFARDVANALDGDRRVIRLQERMIALSRDGHPTVGVVIPFERNFGYCVEMALARRQESGELAIGSRREALITDVQPPFAVIDIDGAQGIIPIDEVSWHLIEDCTRELSVGDRVAVELLAIRIDEHEVVASRRRCLPEPFSVIDPKSIIGSRQTMVVTSRAGTLPGRRFVAGYLKGMQAIPGRIYETELEWGGALYGVQHIPDGSEVPVVVYEAHDNAQFVFCSCKRLVGNKWDEIRRKYAPGQNLEVTVSAVRDEGVWCEIEAGLVGFVPSDEFRRAGLEYVDYRANVHEGQKLFVIVNRVVAGQRQRVSLGLQVNRRTR